MQILAHLTGGVVLVLTLLVFQTVGENISLTILHTNDVHSRFLQTNQHGGECSPKDEAKASCYGGFPRLFSKVEEIRSQTPNVLYLNGGDYFQGTIWFYLMGWKIVSKYVNRLNHTAMALGNHEFDNGLGNLSAFLKHATFPILSANIDASSVPKIQNLLRKSLHLKVQDTSVGIIGYTTKDTKEISSPGSLKFEDEIQAVRKEAERLNAEGVKILIALGHAGYDVDLKIAASVPLIDIVVGGHTHSFLYHGTPPDDDTPVGEYPTIVTQPSGKRVPVVQASQFGKYLGYLNVTFDEHGELLEYAGNPILLNMSIPQDEDMLAELKEIKEQISEKVRRVEGQTFVFLNGSRIECRLRECNLGNLIADAMLHVLLPKKIPAEGEPWSPVTMAVMNGGGIRASIDEISKNGNITVEDILTVLPFRDTIDVIKIQGKFLFEAFELAVSKYDDVNAHDLSGNFLQVAGIKVVYDVSLDVGKRVVNLHVLCSQCRVPTYVPVELEAVYSIAVPTYLANGGDGFKVLRDKRLDYKNQGILGSDMLCEYFKARSPITQAVEGRITFVQKNQIAAVHGDPSGSAQLNHSPALMFFIVAIFVVLVIPKRH